MSVPEILIGVVLGLLVNECCEVSPWLVRWSARRRYADPRRAEIRAEELAELIDVRPGKLFKLATAMGFAIAATFASGEAPGPAAQLRQAVRSGLGWVGE